MVWYLQVWDGNLGWDDKGCRLMDFHGEIFVSPDAGKRFVAEEVGYTDMRWFRVSPHRHAGRSRGVHNYSGPPERTLYMTLTRADVRK